MIPHLLLDLISKYTLRMIWLLIKNVKGNTSGVSGVGVMFFGNL